MRRELLLLILVISAIAMIPILNELSGVLFHKSNLGGGGSGGYSLGAYDSLSSLKGNSSVVVYGQVVVLNSTYAIKTSCPECGVRLASFVFEFRADRYLKGDGPTTIYIADGTETNGVISHVIDSRPILAGSSYVLFLSSNWKCATVELCSVPATPLDRTYYVLGNAQGKFLVLNNLVYSYDVLFPDDERAGAVSMNGVLLDEFLAQVSSS